MTTRTGTGRHGGDRHRAGRHVAGRRDPGDGPPVLSARRLAWRGLLAARAPAVVLALLAALTAAFLVVTPRAESVALDEAVGDAVAGAPAQARELGLRATTADTFDVPLVSETPDRGPSAPFADVDRALRSVAGPEVQRLLGTPSWAAQSESATIARPDGTTLRPDGSLAVVRVQSDLNRHVRWVSGGAPGAPTTTRSLAPVVTGHVTAVVPVAVADTTARAWGLEVGDPLSLVPSGRLTPLALVVSGTFTATDPADGFWQAEPRMTGLAAIADPQGGIVTEGAVVASADSYGAVSDGLWRTDPATRPVGSPALTASWRYPLRSTALVAADVPLLRRLLVRLDTDTRLDALPGGAVEVTTGLRSVLDGYDASVSSVRVMTSFATAGLSALAALVLALTAVVAVAGRAREVRLVRARGASRGQLLRQVVGGTALPAVPLAALAVVGGVLLVAGSQGAGTWVEVVLVALVPALAATAAVLLTVHAVERDDSGEETVRRARVVRLVRRVVAELAVVAVAAAAVGTVRARGDRIAGGRTDWYAALTPVLVGAVAALVVLRVLPPLVRAAARVAARRRGLVGFLGLARAARTGATAALPVLAVVVGAVVLALLTALTVTVAEQREVAAYRAVGAEVRVDAVRVDADDAAAIAARPGVRRVVRAYVATGAGLVSGRSATAVVVVAVDPAEYATLLRDTPVALAEPPASTGEGLTLLVGPGTATGGDLELTVRGARLPVERVVVDPGLVRLGTGQEEPAVLVPLDRLADLVPSAQPNTAFVEADPGAAAALRGLRDPSSATPSGRVTGIDTVQAAEARVSARALPRLVAGTYLAGAVLAAVLTLLAVALLLVASRPERTALVIRLRTMGMPHGGERALAWTEVLPVVAVAGLAGAGVGAAAPALVAAAVDLAPFTGGSPRPPLPVVPLAAAGAGALVLVLGALALVLDAAAARRSSLADHLRKGDTA
ncbi:FtsX-like permease family protein [Phycicoccus avicenniae]|uniref:FtsX-like permease family protein n=1 Tax=Phycicoccus avicenniae TaxID=2828860 RepID=UPI003D296E1D